MLAIIFLFSSFGYRLGAADPESVKFDFALSLFLMWNDPDLSNIWRFTTHACA